MPAWPRTQRIIGGADERGRSAVERTEPVLISGQTYSLLDQKCADPDNQFSGDGARKILGS